MLDNRAIDHEDRNYPANLLELREQELLNLCVVRNKQDEHPSIVELILRTMKEISNLVLLSMLFAQH